MPGSLPHRVDYGRDGAAHDLASRGAAAKATARLGATRRAADAARLTSAGGTVRCSTRTPSFGGLIWFTAEPLPDPLQLAQSLREQGIAFVTRQVAPGTLHGSVHGVRLSLLEYRYPQLADLRTWGGSRVAARADLDAMKLAALAQRGAEKDFVDVYALGSRSSSLRQMLRWYQEKHAVGDLAHVLYSLAYFDDADRERMPAWYGTRPGGPLKRRSDVGSATWLNEAAEGTVGLSQAVGQLLSGP